MVITHDDDAALAALEQQIAASLGKAAPPFSLSQDEVAQVLGVEPETLAVWRSRGTREIEFIKVGRNVRYRPRAVAVFIAENTYKKVRAANATGAAAPRKQTTCTDHDTGSRRKASRARR